MQYLKLAFYKGNKFKNKKASWMDIIVCIATRSKYSHVELVYHMDYVGNKAWVWSSSPVDGGVRHAILDLEPQQWDLYKVKDTHDTESLHVWFSEQNGKKYDWFGALGVKFKIFKQDNNKWFCSEIIASYFGLKRPHRQSPKRLYSLLKPRLIKANLEPIK